MPIGFANRDKHLHQQGSMQIVHELDKMLARLGQRLRMIVRTKFAAGDIQIATLLEQLAKLVWQVETLMQSIIERQRDEASAIAQDCSS